MTSHSSYIFLNTRSAEEDRYVLKCGGFTTAEGLDFVTWLEQDLIKANSSRKERPWIIVAGHHPMYCVTGYNQQMADAIEELLYTYEVDLMLTGHVHDYEVRRTPSSILECVVFYFFYFFLFGTFEQHMTPLFLLLLFLPLSICSAFDVYLESILLDLLFSSTYSSYIYIYKHIAHVAGLSRTSGKPY